MADMPYDMYLKFMLSYCLITENMNPSPERKSSSTLASGQKSAHDFGGSTQPRLSIQATESNTSMETQPTLRQDSTKLINSTSTMDSRSSDRNPRLKTLDEYIADKPREAQVTSPPLKSPRVSRRDDFFDQSIRDRDYSSVIESLSTATDPDNRNDFPSDKVVYTQGEELSSTSPRLRAEPRESRQSRELKKQPSDDDTARISVSEIESNKGHVFVEGFQVRLVLLCDVILYVSISFRTLLLFWQAGRKASSKEDALAKDTDDQSAVLRRGPSMRSAARDGNLDRVKKIAELRPEEKV